MLKSFCLSVILGFLSCDKANGDKENNVLKKELITNQKQTISQGSLNNEEKLIKQFLELFDANAVSVQDFEELFGRSSAEGEEYFFFKECESENTFDYCFKAYDDYFSDPAKCESLNFKEIKKNSLVQELLMPENKTLILKSLDKMSDNKYQAKVGDNTIKFILRMNEASTKLVFSDVYINEKSIFWGIFKN